MIGHLIALRRSLAFVAVTSLALSACSGDEPPDEAAGAGATSEASGAAATGTAERRIGDLFPALPAPYGYEPQDAATAAQFEKAMGSEERKLIKAMEGRPITHDGQQIGVQVAYLLNDIDREALLAGYVEGSGGGKVSKVKLAGAEVSFIERPGGDLRFAYAYFSGDVAVFVSTTTKEHADSVASAVVSAL